MKSAVIDTSIFIGSENGRLDLPAIPVTGTLSTATLEELWLGVLRAAPEDLYKRRQTGLADALIGATARHLGLPVFTQDSGFAGMAGVDVHVV